MCELFGLCASRRVGVHDYLREFFSHSEQHCHGWGLALFYGDGVSLEKEPLCANSSEYLKQRMRGGLEAANMIAHIRLASVGRLFYENTHPFVRRDNRGGCWTLAHNGTIFDGTLTDCFADRQTGQTDSERILMLIIDRVNALQDNLHRKLEADEKAQLLDKLIAELSVRNKLNLLVWDGERMYVHTNYADTLFSCRICGDGILFSTHPLSGEEWQPVPMRQLRIYEEGRLMYEGHFRGQEYFDPEPNYEYRNLDYAAL